MSSSQSNVAAFSVSKQSLSLVSVSLEQYYKHLRCILQIYKICDGFVSFCSTVFSPPMRNVFAALKRHRHVTLLTQSKYRSHDHSVFSVWFLRKCGKKFALAVTQSNFLFPNFSICLVNYNEFVRLGYVI